LRNIQRNYIISISLNLFKGIDCDQARGEEERLMLNDAEAWRSGAPGKDSIHPVSGATALHVAAGKGYIKVMQ